MAKYGEQFKLKLVKEYQAGAGGVRTIAQRHGVGCTVLRRWIAVYEQHGREGLRKKYSHYDAQFRMSVLSHMWRENLSCQQAAAVFDIRAQGAIAKWERQYHAGGIDALAPRPRGRPRKMTRPDHEKPTGKTAPDERTREQLLKENEYLRAEVAYPKKARCPASGEEAGRAKEKTQIVQALRDQHPMAALLKAAGLARSTFYYQLKVLEDGDRHAELKTRIRAVYEHHKGRYGYRRIAATIRQSGQIVNHKTVQRLMGHLKLKSLIRAKKYRSWRGEVGRIAPNLLNREFSAQQPNQKWVTDVTEFNVLGQKLYLSPVMDLYNGEIVSYQMSERPVFELVRSMLKKALAKLGSNERPLLHSDQGWQYQMSAYRRMLDQRGLTQSMSRKANCHDNAAIESFFGTLKSEFFRLNRFESIDALKAGIKQYIHYYNHKRIKLKLKGLSPVMYRTQPSTA
ncbi:IS3 family transposase [Burkholderia sp. WSM2232]|uniref:IS3 family transposase n=4 Tax=Burkholderia sp. WSM2232 TaxID=944436 RepID=UPI0012EB6B37|nr:IS3 family transposase [Burkholderia sp. WSM2232]